MSIEIQYTPILDGKGKPVIDTKTGKIKQRIASKTVTANIYTNYIWDDEKKRFQGVNKAGERTEVWHYDVNGNRIPNKDQQML